jgi:hypothetical protein
MGRSVLGPEFLRSVGPRRLLRPTHASLDHGDECRRRAAKAMTSNDESLPLVNVSRSGAANGNGYASISKPPSTANGKNGSRHQGRGRPRLDKQLSLQESLRDLSNRISSMIASHTGTYFPRALHLSRAPSACSYLIVPCRIHRVLGQHVDCCELVDRPRHAEFAVHV